MSDLGEYVLSGKEINPNVVRSIDKVEGGGNPNRSETYTGTLYDPWGDYSVAELATLYDEISARNASMILVLDASALGITQPVPLLMGAYSNTFEGAAASGSLESLSAAIIVAYSKISGELDFCVTYASDGTGTDISAYASQLPTTFTIYWHPMTEDEK